MRSYLLFGAVSLAVVVLLGSMASLPIAGPDEGRYLEASRGMAESGDWLVPRFAGVERFEKPPLFYWVTALAFRLLGSTEWVARLGPALAAAATVLVILCFGRLLSPAGGGRAAAIALLTSPFYLHMARTVQTDTLLCLFLTVALTGFRQGLASRQWRHYLLFFAAAAAATLTKGPAGLALPLIVAATYLTLARQWRLIAWEKVLGGTLLYAFLAAPWFLAIQARYPGFLRYTLVSENLERYGQSNHADSLLTCVVPLVLGMFPWSLLVFWALWRSWRERGVRGNERAGDASLFLWSWAGVVAGFFSLSRFKMPWYVLPAFPPLALLAGAEWERILGAAAGGEDRRAKAGFAAAALAGLLLTAVSEHVREQMRAREGVAVLADAIRQQLQPGDRVILYGWQRVTSLPFYLLRGPGPEPEVLYLPPQRAHPLLGGGKVPAKPVPLGVLDRQFLTDIDAPGRIVCFMRRPHFDRLKAAMAAAGVATIWAQSRDYLVVARTSPPQNRSVSVPFAPRPGL
jgi:4-amino-4-deoxy-L-arabinose transferase-like glycosyltransferase